MATAQNLGIGTTTPLDKVHIKGGDLLLENGKVTTVKSGRGRNLLPIAIASVTGLGVLTGGTSNVTATLSGTGSGVQIDIGESITGTQAFVTPISTAKSYGIVVPLGGTRFEARFYDFNGNQNFPDFSIIVYKTGNDAYREYNITIADDTNGISISHGNFGISTAAVDSMRITILVPDTVLIGGGLSNGAGISINLPAHSSVKITNYGKIVGIGGRGGTGESTYSAGSPVGQCLLPIGPGNQGGAGIGTNTKLVVDNYGFIAGGGGGGGGGKTGAGAGANGGGGGAGAGWPIPVGGNNYGLGGNGGYTFVAVAQGGYCPGEYFPCNALGGCCSVNK